AKSDVDNQVAKSDVDNQVAKSDVDNQVAKPEVDNQVAKPEVDNQVAKSEVDNQVAKPEVDNQVAKSEVDNQVAKPEVGNQVDNSVNVLDIVWDGWLNSVKLTQTYQREIEGMAFKAIERQKDIWLQSRENLEKAENEINKFTDDAKSCFNENLKNLNGRSISKNVGEWNKQVEEITNRLQQLYGTPVKASSNLVGKSLDQIESILKTIIQQQQKSQNEVQTLLENFIDQVKATNKVVMETWETNHITKFNMFK
ncbi:hypothetical protein, partial [Ammoniphilus sp. 3BR4]|uniref:hypothetical protein n=1 Tax=Ammoniphilus sp. 3BR4 TaxID=3158265 RepID=UPI00346690A4